MWHDKYVTQLFGDDEVKVDRYLASPAGDDELHMVFSDGSELLVKLEALPKPNNYESEMAAADVAAETTAYKAFYKLFDAIAGRASDIQDDVDRITVRVVARAA